MEKENTNTRKTTSYEKEDTNTRKQTKQKTKQNKKKNKKQATSYKMIFQSEHTEDISYVYVVNQIFESVSDLRLTTKFHKTNV